LKNCGELLLQYISGEKIHDKKKIFLNTNKPPTYTIPFLEILCLLTIQDIKSLIKFGATK
jgi:hypothetical protein